VQSVNQKNNSQNIAIIAGRGVLPKIIFDKLSDDNLGAFVISFDSDNNEFLQPDYIANMGQVGAVVTELKKAEIKKIVFAGGIVKPKLIDLKLDKEAAKLLGKMAFSKFFGKLPGDDKLFKVILGYLEKHGLEIIGVDEVMPELLAEKGILGTLAPTKAQLADIHTGCAAAKVLGEKDEGQAVVCAGGELIATEDEKGTDNLLERAVVICSEKNLPKAVLVKCVKPQQDRRIDLPSIGVQTIEKLAANGFAGVAVEAGSSIIIDKQAVAAKADELGVFVFGI